MMSIRITKEKIRDLFEKVKAGKASAVEVELAYNLKLKAVQQDYTAFCHEVYPTVVWKDFQLYVMSRLNEALSKRSGFIIIELPPQHAKTTLASTLLVPYIHGRFPDRKVILAAYGGDRAKSNAKLISDTMALESYKEIFPTRLRGTYEKEIDDMFNEDLRQTAYAWNLSADPRGSFLATSVGGVLTGESGDVLILDDYNKDSITAKSVTERQNTFEWFVSSFYTRKQVNTMVLVFATRWHADDLIGRLKVLRKQNPELFNFDLISLPALQDESPTTRPYDQRKLHEPLWEEKLTDYLAQQHLSAENFAALYQQKPLTEQGVIFDSRHFKEFNAYPEHFDLIVLGVDTSLKAKTKESDDCAMVVLGKINKDWYLLSYVTRRMRFVETIEEAKNIHDEYRCRTMVIEGKSNGPALIEMLELSLPGVNLIECDMGPVSKRAKAEMTTPIFAAGNFHIPTKELYPPVEAFKTQFLQFTGDDGGKDDLVDATVIILLKLGELEYRIPKNSARAISSMSSKFIGNLAIDKTKKVSSIFPAGSRTSSILDGASSRNIAAKCLRS